MTELDHTILGVVARDGPLSAYEVRRVFARSTTPLWSSSQGSVYPAIKRLLAADWIRATDVGGARRRKDLNITEKGKIALEAWLGDLASWMGAVTADPIRTRAYFLPLVPVAQRRRFVTEALRYTDEAIEHLERLRDATALDEQNDDLSSHERLVDLGAVYALKAKRQWLQQVAAELQMERER